MALPLSTAANIRSMRILRRMIAVHNVTYTFGSGSGLTFPDFVVPQGEPCLLLGESGSGKTTLLHLLGGLLRGYQGSIRLNEVELHTLSEHELDMFRGQRLGFIFQKNHLISSLTVEQNLTIAPFLAGMPVDRQRVKELLSHLGLETKRHNRVRELSHGQAQRVAIARAVINKPTLVLADEPTSALDDRHCTKVLDLLLEMTSADGATLLIATHDQRLKSRIQRQVPLTNESGT